MTGAGALSDVAAAMPACADGRRWRSTTTRRDILAACRRFMMEGIFRPGMAECCELARRSERSGYQHFSIEELHKEALLDETVREVIATWIVGAEIVALSPQARDRIVRIIVLGRQA